MFDFAWTEIALIVVVAVVFIGPKDLPVAIKAVTGMLKKARRMAGEFQTHVDEMVREADLGEVRDGLNKIRNFDFKSTVERAIDPDNTLRDTFANDPFAPSISPAPAAETIAEHDTLTIERPPGIDSAVDSATVEAEVVENIPAFIPPGFVLGYHRPEKPAAAEPPAFIPPGAAG
jgi:sec-independent protein translocase protein TatB